MGDLRTPLRLITGDEPERDYVVMDAAGEEVYAETLDLARRIVAAVNATARMDLDALEACAIPAQPNPVLLRAEVEGLTAALKKAQAENARLREALEMVSMNAESALPGTHGAVSNAVTAMGDIARAALGQEDG